MKYAACLLPLLFLIACQEAGKTTWKSVPFDKMVLHGDVWNYRPIGKPLEVPVVDSNSLNYWQSYVSDSLTVLGTEELIPLSYALFLQQRESRFIEVIERSLWNDGLVKAYQNHTTTYHPGTFTYSMGDDSLWINLYLANSTQIHMGETTIGVRIGGEYPWEEKISISLQLEQPTRFALGLRIPGFAQNQAVPGNRFTYLYNSNRKLELRVNEELVMPDALAGYAVLDREWKNDDQVELILPMAVRRIQAESQPNKLILERGPLVYSILKNEKEEVWLSKSRQYFITDSLHGKYHIAWLRGPVWKDDQWIERKAAPLFHLVAEEKERGSVWLPYR